MNAVGNLGMTLATGEEYFGALTTDGGFAVLGGGTSAGAPQAVWIFVRN